jgi:hypothetical protein
LNSRTKEFIASAGKSMSFITLGDFVVGSDGNCITWTNSSRRDRVVDNWTSTIGGNLDISSGKNVIIIGGQQLTLNGKSIQIGAGSAAEPMVLGKQLVNVLSKLISALTSGPIALVTGGTGSPSQLNPIIQAKLSIVKSLLNEILSEDNTVTRKNSPQPRTIGSYKEGQ